MRHIFCRDGRALLTTRLIAQAAIAAVLATSAGAGGPPSCKSISKGSLDVELPAGQRSSRMVKLRAGDIVNFSVHGGASGATVNLVSGYGAPKALLEPGTSGITSFTAPVAETYVFAIEAGSGSLTSVSVNCTGAGQSVGQSAGLSGTVDAEGDSRRSSFSAGFAEIAATTTPGTRAPLSDWCDGDGATVAIDASSPDGDGANDATLDLHTRIASNGVVEILERIERVEPHQTSGIGTGAAAALLWSAALSPDLTFETAPQPAVVTTTRTRPTSDARVASAPATTATLAALEPAVEGWWLTYLDDKSEGSGSEASPAPPASRNAIAASSFPPPMALGARLPADDAPAATP